MRSPLNELLTLSALGIVTIGEGLTKSFAGLVVCRVLLGALEAGFFPGNEEKPTRKDSRANLTKLFHRSHISPCHVLHPIRAPKKDEYLLLFGPTFYCFWRGMYLYHEYGGILIIRLTY